MSHVRNTGAMQASPRCGAQSRRGEPCRAPALRGKARCRMHGGAAGSGAPFGNSNAVTHGYFTSEAIEERRFVRAVLIEAESLLRRLPAGSETIGNPSESEIERTTLGTYSALRA
ncbi:HGGxSTG domain-containing protein [Bradyrhizobium sp. CCBAU 53338]|uniref:HGGxSTG domain-containing protein n=1 Tax=Bradyrhizobium sp. CCBAU 53338 TaxID=1325111 RepID=UPI001FEFBD9E|nr:HGGxSTG domain-containing protein [Bradyrhizobium sp. CCBAU 53338]